MEEFLETLINQDYKNLEIILIDDGSTDNSLNICKAYSLKDRRITVLTQPNQGVSSARNSGLNHSGGEYIIFLDPDDKIEKEMINKLYQTATKLDLDVTMCNFWIFNKEKEYVHFLADKYKKNNYISCETAIESILDSSGFQGFVWNKFFKKDVIGETKFEEAIFYLEDALFNISIIKEGISIGVCNENLYHYRKRNDSAVNLFSCKQLTYLKSLDLIEKNLPNKFKDIVLINKLIFLINISSKAFIRSRKVYKFAKEKFKIEKKYIEIPKVKSDKKSDIFLLKIADRSFILAVILCSCKNWIVKRHIYYRIKNYFLMRK
ncbi:glycosyltransferase [Enterococcus faecium]|nr:glycosyltransferase [Enterococcus faecium]